MHGFKLEIFLKYFHLNMCFDVFDSIILKLLKNVRPKMESHIILIKYVQCSVHTAQQALCMAFRVVSFHFTHITVDS